MIIKRKENIKRFQYDARIVRIDLMEFIKEKCEQLSHGLVTIEKYEQLSHEMINSEKCAQLKHGLVTNEKCEGEGLIHGLVNSIMVTFYEGLCRKGN